MYRFCALLAWLLVLLGCAKDEHSVAADETSVAWIRIRNFQGATPQSYLVSVGDRKAYCGSPDFVASGMHCTADGVALAFTPDSLSRIIIKATGHKTYVDTLDFRYTDTASITLDTLAAFMQNSDQSTGITPEDGYALFQKMAYQSSSELGENYLLKFIITNIVDNPTVHLQNTLKYQLHYEFAQKVLGETRSVDEFEQDLYYSDNRSAIAGTLAYYPALDSSIALTFFSTDNISTELVIRAHRLIEERLQFLAIAGTRNRLYYLPAGSAAERRMAAQTSEFSFQDIPCRTHAQLFGNIKLQILNTGIAYGTLRRLAPEELDTAILSAHDIVILPRLPAELPLVGGSISEEAQTPLSHVNLAAKARNTPNIAFNGAEVPDSLLALLDSLVKFRVNNGGYTLTKASPEEARKYWESQYGDILRPEYDLSATGLLDFSALGFTSSQQVGVKAANLAELHHLLADRSPDGFAVPFYYYDQYLSYATVTDSLCRLAQEDCVNEGRSPTLCARALQACQEPIGTEPLGSYIARVIGRNDFLSDSRTREAMLDGVQYLFRHIPLEKSFATLLNNKVKQMFGGASVRLRSSTNAEDLANFNGAGLYESVSASTRSGDLPADEIGKVWASVWSFRAYEERAWWNMDHLSVKMGVAVHQAFSAEQVNGVVLSQNVADFSVAGIYANVQLGETSITNPADGSRPEIISIIPNASGETQTVHSQYSSLSPETPLLSDQEAAELYQTVRKIQEHFAVLYQQSPNALILDLEFKLIGPERQLLIKQVRPYIP